VPDILQKAKCVQLFPFYSDETWNGKRNSACGSSE